MKCKQSRPGFELVSPYPFPTTITITPRALSDLAKASIVHMLSITYINNIDRGDARGVMVIVVGNGHGDASSNTGRDCLHFT